jgi:hypothetical protein
MLSVILLSAVRLNVPVKTFTKMSAGVRRDDSVVDRPRRRRPGERVDGQAGGLDPDRPRQKPGQDQLSPPDGRDHPGPLQTVVLGTDDAAHAEEGRRAALRPLPRLAGHHDQVQKL